MVPNEVKRANLFTVPFSTYKIYDLSHSPTAILIYNYLHKKVPEAVKLSIKDFKGFEDTFFYTKVS